MAKSVDPDETAHYGTFDLHLHCLHKKLFSTTLSEDVLGNKRIPPITEIDLMTYATSAYLD